MNNKTCKDKRSFFTRKLARQQRKAAERKTGKHLRIYRCPHCGDFHYTTMSAEDHEWATHGRHTASSKPKPKP